MPFFHKAFEELSKENPIFTRAYHRVWWAEFWMSAVVLTLSLSALGLAIWLACHGEAP